MKKAFSYYLSLTLVLFVSIFCFAPNFNEEEYNDEIKGISGYWSEVTGSAFTKGLGTAVSPYIIENENQFIYMVKHSSSYYYYKLNSQIDLGSRYWNLGYAFNGIFDGGFCSINNLTISSGARGLFAINDGTIKNICLNSPSTNTFSNDLGFIAGINSGSIINALIINPYANISASMTSSSFGFGAVTGWGSSNSKIENVQVKNANFSVYNSGGANLYVGGICGGGSSLVTGARFQGNISLRANGSDKNIYAGGIAGNANSINNAIVDYGSSVVSNVTSKTKSSVSCYSHHKTIKPFIGLWRYVIYLKKVTVYTTSSIYISGIAHNATCSNVVLNNVTLSGLHGSETYTIERGPSSEITSPNSDYFSGLPYNSDGVSTWQSLPEERYNTFSGYAGWPAYYEGNKSSGSIGGVISFARNGSVSNSIYYNSNMIYGIPSGFSTSIWGVKNYINGGEIHFKSWYWEDNI